MIPFKKGTFRSIRILADIGNSYVYDRNALWRGISWSSSAPTMRTVRGRSLYLLSASAQLTPGLKESQELLR